MTSVCEINCALFEYIVNEITPNPSINPWLWSEINRITICLAHPVWQTVDDLELFLGKLSAGIRHKNQPRTIHANLSYLHFIRDHAIHFLEGRLHNLIVLGISNPDLVRILARLPTQQIEEMAFYHNGPIFTMDEACYSQNFDKSSSTCIPSILITMRHTNQNHHSLIHEDLNIKKYLPATAKPTSPLYKGRFHDIAIDLIRHGLKPVFVKNLTDISDRDAAALYKELHPNKLMKRGTAKIRLPNYYVMPKDYGAHWRLSASCYACIVKKLEQLLPQSHKAWLLLKSYETYRKLCWSLLHDRERPSIKTDDAHCICNYIFSKQLILKVCPICGATHLHSPELEPDPRHCPVCALHKRYQHLSRASTQISEERRIARECAGLRVV
jgi:rubredoxin